MFRLISKGSVSIIRLVITRSRVLIQPQLGIGRIGYINNCDILTKEVERFKVKFEVSVNVLNNKTLYVFCLWLPKAAIFIDSIKKVILQFDIISNFHDICAKRLF